MAGAVLVLGGVLVAKGPWSAEAAAWVQAIGSLFAVAIAIYVPARIESEKVRREVADLWDRRRQAWRTMHEVAAAIARRDLVRPGEIEAIGALLDHIDLGVIPERAIQTLVILRTEIAMSGASVGAHAAVNAVGNPFHGKTMLNNLQGIRQIMGVAE